MSSSGLSFFASSTVFGRISADCYGCECSVAVVITHSACFIGHFK